MGLEVSEDFVEVAGELGVSEDFVEVAEELGISEDFVEVAEELEVSEDFVEVVGVEVSGESVADFVLLQPTKTAVEPMPSRSTRISPLVLRGFIDFLVRRFVAE